MLNIFSGLSAGNASDGLSHDIAKRNGHDKPNYKDRFQAAMSIIFNVSIFINIIMSAYIFPEMKLLLSSFIGKSIIISLFSAILIGAIGVIVLIVLSRMPFWIIALFFTISTSYLITIFVLAMQ